MVAQRNWADLNKDLLHLIYTKLPPDLHYFVRFRSVCKDWRSSVLISDLPLQLPWLLEYQNARHVGDSLQHNLRCYSLASGETGTIRVPEPYRAMVYHGPGHGYLLVSSSEQDLYLLNPLTAVAISLAPLYYFYEILWPVCSGSDPILNWHMSSCFLSLSDIIRRWTSLIYHKDKMNWTYVDNNLYNTCCWDGKIFATSAGRCTRVFNAVSGEELVNVPRLEDEDYHVRRSYLVESCGEILRISRYLRFDGPQNVEDSKFHIYELIYEEGGEPRWVKISGIGNQIVFLDVMNGFSIRAPAGFEGNCIYFMLEDGSTPCRYDIGTGTVERVPCPFRRCTWFIPIPNLG